MAVADVPCSCDTLSQDGAGLTNAKANQAELDMVQLRGELATVRSEASYMKTRVRELDEELASASFHLANVQEENTTLIEECERLQAANKAAGIDAGRSVSTERTLRHAARRAWEDYAADALPPSNDRADGDEERARHRDGGRTNDRHRRRRDEERLQR